MAGTSACHNYITFLHDILDSEELKIESEYSKRIKETIEEICVSGNDKFEECFVEVQGAIGHTVDVNKPLFRQMYLYLAEDLPKVVSELPKEH